MKTLFREMQTKQSDALTKAFVDGLLKLFADTTKQDLIMNNYVVRAKSVKSGTGSVVSKADKEEKKGGKKEKKVGYRLQQLQVTAEAHSGSSENDEQDDDDDLGDELFVGFEAGDDQQGEAKETGGQAFLGGHSIHEDYNEEMASLSVPVLAHGDEGRGKCKRHSLTTRMLFTVIPSEMYWGDLTLQQLLGAM
ncbi:unnamed protein product, partial [Symbiodinium necroappetens]